MIPQAYLLDKGNYPSDRFFIEQSKVASAIIEAAASGTTNSVEVEIPEDFIKEFVLQLDDDGFIVTYSGHNKLLIRW